MRLKFFLPLLASVSMVSAPVLAAAQPARVATPVTKTEQARGLGAGGIVVGLLALAAIIAGILAATKGNDRPNSP